MIYNGVTKSFKLYHSFFTATGTIVLNHLWSCEDWHYIFSCGFKVAHLCLMKISSKMKKKKSFVPALFLKKTFMWPMHWCRVTSNTTNDMCICLTYEHECWRSFPRICSLRSLLSCWTFVKCLAGFACCSASKSVLGLVWFVQLPTYKLCCSKAFLRLWSELVCFVKIALQSEYKFFSFCSCHMCSLFFVCSNCWSPCVFLDVTCCDTAANKLLSLKL